MRLTQYNILITLITLFFFNYAYAENIKNEPPKTGNFILPYSQQPGPLVGFGENIIDKNLTQLFVFADDYSGVGKYQVDIVPGILYGITDNLSVFLNVPIAASYKQNKNYSSGLEDAFLQFEYAFYTKSTSTFIDQATIVTNISFPTGSSNKVPPTGFGSPSIFIGATYNRTYTDWFVFTSHGALFPTSHGTTKFGNEFFYQFGFGRNLFDIDSKWIYALMTEIDGQYSGENRINGVTDTNSGGNTVYVTPSLWISSKKLIFQLGVGLPVAQHLYGNQKRETYLLVTNIGWTL